MPTVLVVDDSSAHRDRIGRLLGSHADWHVEYAAHGGEALIKIGQSEPDLVVTDLIMPEVNGLELVASVRERHPLVPVILMTSKGCEEVAVQALQRGAAGYVPKQLVARLLPDTILKILAVSGRQRSHTRLMGCMTETDYAFVLENDCELIPPMVTYLQESVAQLGTCREADRTRVGIALEEALANAIFHGNLEIGSELRNLDQDAYYALVEKRRNEPPYRDRRVRVEAAVSASVAMFTVRDEGPGFDPSQLPDPTDPANLEKSSGRGILLMRTFMDEVTFNEKGNEVLLVKHIG